MKILLDTNVILNDFFHRQPEFGFQRISDPEQIRQVEAYRLTVHESLLFLSLQPEVEIWTTTAILARLGSLMGDLLVPPAMVLDEMNYWLSNYKLAETHSKDLEESLLQMGNADPKLDFEDYLVRYVMTQNGLDMLVTSLPKSREFFWPILVFKPEKLKDLTFQEGGLPMPKSD
jgi:hypothetical protein